MKTRIMHKTGRLAAVIVLCLCAFVLSADAAGPFKIELRQGTLEADLMRMDGDLVWIRRKMDSGQTYESGIKVTDFVRVNTPWPAQFDQLDLADTPQKVARLEQQLTYYIKNLEPFRSLPGVRVDEALIRTGQLLEQREKWNEALKVYASVVQGGGDPEVVGQARLRSGICRTKMGEDEEALNDLDKDLVPPDDTALLSEVCFARGDVLHRLERYDDAILEYLYPVVFMPFMDDNEVRGLGDAMECYVALEDWRALTGTIKELRERYPDSGQAARAEEILAQYADKLSGERDFQVGYEEDMKETEGE